MGITNLNIHSGKTQKIRVTDTAPTDPTPTTGDVFADSSSGTEAIKIFLTNDWSSLGLTSV